MRAYALPHLCIGRRCIGLAARGISYAAQLGRAVVCLVHASCGDTDGACRRKWHGACRAGVCMIIVVFKYTHRTVWVQQTSPRPSVQSLMSAYSF
jgi:hypothetical protein